MPKEKTITIVKEDFPEGFEDEASIYVGEYTIRRWTYGEHLEAQDRATKLDLATFQGTILPGKLSLEKIVACITKAPFDTTNQSKKREFIESMPPFLGTRLLLEVNAILGEITEKRRKQLKKSLDAQS